MLPPYVLVYAFKGQVHVFASVCRTSENSESLVVQDKSNIEIFLYILILKTLTCDPFTWLYNKPPGGGGVLWYFHTYVGSGHFLGLKILNFNIFVFF